MFTVHGFVQILRERHVFDDDEPAFEGDGCDDGAGSPSLALGVVSSSDLLRLRDSFVGDDEDDDDDKRRSSKGDATHTYCICI